MESRSIAPTTGTSLLLAAVGRESSDEAVVWQYAPADSRAVASGGIAEAVEPSQIKKYFTGVPRGVYSGVKLGAIIGNSG